MNLPQLDQHIFQFINQQTTSPTVDVLMAVLSTWFFWRPFALSGVILAVNVEPISVIDRATATAFVSAIVVMHWLIRYVQRHNYDGYAAYRVVVGIIVSALLWTNR